MPDERLRKNETKTALTSHDRIKNIPFNSLTNTNYPSHTITPQIFLHNRASATPYDKKDAESRGSRGKSRAVPRSLL